jgi:hypothetical protein
MSNIELLAKIKRRVLDLKLPALSPGINLVGLEGYFDSKDVANQFNDAVALIILDVKLNPVNIQIYRATTEPGQYYTYNPLNPLGVARLAIDTFHPKLWGFGVHRGYAALVQQGIATIVRDVNKDGFRNDKLTKESGNGINLHTTKDGYTSLEVGKWSAGCVVIQDPVKFREFLALVKNYQSSGLFGFYLLDYSKLT